MKLPTTLSVAVLGSLCALPVRADVTPEQWRTDSSYTAAEYDGIENDLFSDPVWWSKKLGYKPENGPMLTKVSVDRKAFDAHFLHEKAKTTARDANTPANYCGDLSTFWLRDESTGYDRSCSETSAELQKKVTAIVCSFRETGKPAIELKGSTLLLVMTPTMSADYHSDLWMAEAFKKAFPSYKKCRP